MKLCPLAHKLILEYVLKWKKINFLHYKKDYPVKTNFSVEKFRWIFRFDSLRPINNLSVIKGWEFDFGFKRIFCFVMKKNYIFSTSTCKVFRYILIYMF